MKTGKKFLWLSLVFFLLFAAFTAIIMTVDVQPIGPEGTSVGLATFNGADRKSTRLNSSHTS